MLWVHIKSTSPRHFQLYKYPQYVFMEKLEKQISAYIFVEKYLALDMAFFSQPKYVSIFLTSQQKCMLYLTSTVNI